MVRKVMVFVILICAVVCFLMLLRTTLMVWTNVLFLLVVAWVVFRRSLFYLHMVWCLLIRLVVVRLVSFCILCRLLMRCLLRLMVAICSVFLWRRCVLDLRLLLLSWKVRLVKLLRLLLRFMRFIRILILVLFFRVRLRRTRTIRMTNYCWTHRRTMGPLNE